MQHCISIPMRPAKYCSRCHIPGSCLEERLQSMPNEDLMNMHDQFAVIREIDWCVLESSTIHINGKEILTKEFFHQHGILFIPSGRYCWFHVYFYASKQTFIGPDGHPFRWVMLLSIVVVNVDSCVRAWSGTQPAFLSVVLRWRIQGRGCKILVSQGVLGSGK